MIKEIKQQQKGAVEVEATFLFPIMILCIFLLLYLSLFLYQRANLQATLETSLLYYKNILTDTFVSKNEELAYQMDEGAYIGYANSYSAAAPLNPYRWVDGEYINVHDFTTYFSSVAENMLFSENIEIKYDYSNYFLLKEIVVTVEQVMEIPINLEFLGIGNEYTISATGRMVAVDHEDTIRNIDYVISIVEDTQVGDFIKNISAKVQEYYGKFKEFLGL